EQAERIVDEGSGFEQERKIGGENGDILDARLTKYRRAEALDRRPGLLGDGLDGDEAEILDAVGDFAHGGRRNLAAHDFAALGEGAVSKIGHDRHRKVVT